MRMYTDENGKRVPYVCMSEEEMRQAEERVCTGVPEEDAVELRKFIRSRNEWSRLQHETTNRMIRELLENRSRPKSNRDSIAEHQCKLCPAFFCRKLYRGVRNWVIAVFAAVDRKLNCAFRNQYTSRRENPGKM